MDNISTHMKSFRDEYVTPSNLRILLRTMFWPLLIFLLVVVAFWGVALPQMRENLLESQKQTTKELTSVVHSILDRYHQEVKDGKLTREEAQNRAAKRVSELRYGPAQQDYFWINNMDYEMVVHPYRSDLEGEELHDFEDPHGKKLIRDMVDICKKQDAGFVSYHWQWHDNPDRIEPKISHVRLHKPWGWVIGSGIYINNVREQVASITQTSHRIFVGIGLLIFLSSILIAANSMRREREKQNAQKKLREKTERLQSVLHGGQVGTWDWDIQTDEVIFNDHWAEMLGYSRDELAFTLKTWKKLMHPDDLPPTEEALNAHLNGKRDFYEAEFRMKHKSGEWIWINNRGRVIEWDEDGNPLRACGTHLDVTERKRAEKKLEENERQLRRAQSAAHFGSWEFDFNNNTVSASPEAYEIYGLQGSEQLSIKRVQNIVLSEYRNMMDKKLEELVEQGESYDVEFQIKRPCDGQIRHIHSVAEYHPNDNVVTGVIQDITERKRAKQNLIAEQQRLEVTLQSIGDGVISTDTDGKITLLNTVAEKHTGWSQSEATGLPIDEVFNIIHEETEKQRKNPVEHVLETGETMELANHTVLVSRDGTERIIADSAAPIRDNDDNMIGVVLVFRDITEKRRMEETRRRAAKLDSLGVLAGGIAHDFNNLLSSIYGYIDLAHEFASDEKVVDYLDKSSNTIDRARHLTTQLLTYAEGGDPVREIQSLTPFLQETVDFALSGSNVKCEFNLPDDLRCCKFDRNQMGQVIDNLVINANEAMPEGGEIVVSARNITIEKGDHAVLDEGPYVEISISDTGTGIPPDLLPRVFDPFFTTKSEGHGLGLATCYSIVEKHGGHMDVESEQGEGTTFHVYLPASLETAEDMQAETSNQHSGSGTLLVMDDDLALREMLTATLESCGYDVITAEKGEDVLDILEDDQVIDGMIFDMTIQGGMGGVDTASEIRNFNEEVPIIVASGYADDPVMANPDEYGFNDSLLKPFRHAELIDVLNEHFG